MWASEYPSEIRIRISISNADYSLLRHLSICIYLKTEIHAGVEPWHLFHVKAYSKYLKRNRRFFSVTIALFTKENEVMIGLQPHANTMSLESCQWVLLPRNSINVSDSSRPVQMCWTYSTSILSRLSRVPSTSVAARSLCPRKQGLRRMLLNTRISTHFIFQSDHLLPALSLWFRGKYQKYAVVSGLIGLLILIPIHHFASDFECNFDYKADFNRFWRGSSFIHADLNAAKQGASNSCCHYSSSPHFDPAIFISPMQWPNICHT